MKCKTHLFPQRPSACLGLILRFGAREVFLDLKEAELLHLRYWGALVASSTLCVEKGWDALGDGWLGERLVQGSGLQSDGGALG